MSRRPLVSVVIPFLDTLRYLPSAVESVFRQSVKDWEILLIDGGSTDGGADWARALADRHPGRVRVLPPRAKGPGICEARVLGARQARAARIAFLDSDDEWNPRFLELQLAARRRFLGRRKGLVYCPAVFWWNNGRVRAKAAPAAGLHEPPGLLAEFLERDYAKTPCATACLIDRDIVLEAAPFAALAGRHMIEDQYLWSHVAMRYPICVNPDLLFWYRQRPDSVCAQGEARGELPALRRRHLHWLMGRVLKRA